MADEVADRAGKTTAAETTGSRSAAEKPAEIAQQATQSVAVGAAVAGSGAAILAGEVAEDAL